MHSITARMDTTAFASIEVKVFNQSSISKQIIANWQRPDSKVTPSQTLGAGRIAQKASKREGDKNRW